jgi:phage gp29-like protein
MSRKHPRNSLAAQGLGLPPIRGAAEQAALNAQPSTLNAAAAKGNRLPPGLERIIRPEAQQRWLLPQVATYTPSYVEMILRGAMAGNHLQQWELFQLMEDTWPRLTKNLNQLKRAVIQLEWDLEAWAEEDAPPSDTAVERKKLVSSAIWGMNPPADGDGSAFEDTIYDILDAYAKGLSVVEVGWEIRDAGALGQIAAPQSTWWVHPQNYAWSQDNQLGLVIPNSQNLEPFPEDKVLIARCKARTGPVAGQALLRALAVWWSFSNFNQSWLMSFAQIFGLPIRWANYDPNQPGLLEKVAEMLENMGSAAWGAFPTGTTLDMKEPMKTGTDNPQITIMDRADKNCDLLILGQSGTTEISGPGKTGGSNAANKVLEGVEWGFVKAAADFAAGVVNRQWIPSILRLNYNGDGTEAPWFCPHPQEIEDSKANAERDGVLLGAGVEMPKKWFYGRHNIPLPQKGEEVIGKPAAMPPDPSTINHQPSTDLQARRHGAAHEVQERLLDNVLEELTGVQPRWLGDVRPFFHELMAAAQFKEITDAEFVAVLERAQKRMPELFGRIKHQELEEVFYNALSTSVVNGAARGFMERRLVNRKSKIVNATGGAK